MGLNQSVQWGNCSSVWKGSRQKILHFLDTLTKKKQTADLLGRSIATSFIPWWGARLVSGTEVVISTCSEKMKFIFILQSVFKLHNTMFIHSSEMRGLYSIKICYILCIEKPWENPSTLVQWRTIHLKWWMTYFPFPWYVVRSWNTMQYQRYLFCENKVGYHMITSWLSLVFIHVLFTLCILCKF